MSHVKIEVPNDDEVALHYFGKAMIQLAAAIRGEDPVDVRVEPITFKIEGDSEEITRRLQQATHVITSEEKVGEPVDLGDGNFSQGYRFEVEELVKQARPVPEFEKMVKEASEEGLAFMKKAEDFLKPHSEAPTTDSTGTPWDERIHSASKALNTDGTWRVRRKPADKTPEEWADYIKWVEEDIHTVLHGQSEDDVEAVREALDKAERGETVYYTSEEAEQKMEEFKESVRLRAEPSVTPQGDDFHVEAGEVTEQEVASIPAPPPPPVVAPAAPSPVRDESYTFPQLMQFLTERHGRITSPQVDQIIADMGLTSIMDLNTQPEHTGPFIARVKAHLGE